MTHTLFDWINERHAIYLRRELALGHEIPEGYMRNKPTASSPYPGLYTKDKELQQYRFCNVFRELDTVTVWIKNHIREPFKDHPYLWFMLAIARSINWPPTLERLMEDPKTWPYDKNFKPVEMAKEMNRIKKERLKLYTGAYMVRAESDRAADFYDDKQYYVACKLIGQFWPKIKKHTHVIEACETQEETWTYIASFYGWGPFTSYEVVTDMRHTRYLNEAPDIMTWANPGPGARRGLNRIHGRPINANLRIDSLMEEMQELLAQSVYKIALWVPALEMRDIEHSLCEYDKWQRAKLGEGRPRSRWKETLT